MVHIKCLGQLVLDNCATFIEDSKYKFFINLEPNNALEAENLFICISRYLRKIFTEDILRDLLGSGEVISELEKEWEQLSRDREALRQIFPSGESKVVLPCNLNRMIWNVQKIFHINKRAPTDLSPLRVIQGKKISLLSLLKLLFLLYLCMLG